MSCKFKPFDRVLRRDTHEDEWIADIFRYYRDNDKDYPYQCFLGKWAYCIPYEGNEHLLDTTKDPEEKEKPFEWGERLIFTNKFGNYEPCIFVRHLENGCLVLLRGYDSLIENRDMSCLSRPTNE